MPAELRILQDCLCSGTCDGTNTGTSGGSTTTATATYASVIWRDSPSATPPGSTDTPASISTIAVICFYRDTSPSQTWDPVAGVWA